MTTKTPKYIAKMRPLTRLAFLLLALLCPLLVMAQSSPQALPYSYGFETTNLTTDGWTIDNPVGSNISAEVSSTYYNSGDKSFLFSAAAVASEEDIKTAYLISPELSINEPSHLFFYFRKDDAAHTGSFQIGYSTTNASCSSFIWIANPITTATTSFASYEYELPADAKYVAFKFESAETAQSLVIDDISVISTFRYGFETADLDADGWTINKPDGSGITTNVSNTYHNYGNKSFLFSADAVAPEEDIKTAYLISPELTIIDISRLSFYFRKVDADHTGSFRIGYSITNANPSSFIWIEDPITTATTSFASLAYTVPANAKYVAFEFKSATTAQSLILDDIKIASCRATNFRCTSRLSKANGVRLEWKDNSDGYATFKIRREGQADIPIASGVTSYTFPDPLPLDVEYTYSLVTICGVTELPNPPSVTVRPTTGPKIEGYVCGGGRLADVEGSSRVEVINCEHLYAVYGGNDIAGEVKAETSHYPGANAYKGAEVKIGKDGVTDRVLIDYVYGGGSGLYSYPENENTYFTKTTTETGGSTPYITYFDGTRVENGDFDIAVGQDTALKAIGYAGAVKGYFNTNIGPVGSLYSGNTVATLSGSTLPTIPKVPRTRVSVNSDNVYIDSLFGGAENAVVGVDVTDNSLPADTSVSITVNKGTVFALFGGNNYGGFLGKGTYQHIVVNGTKTNTSSSLVLGGDKTTGKSHKVTGDVYSLVKTNTGDILAHGIRYLFGGGNHVMSRNVHVEVKGGQIDTLFAGGNLSSVASTLVTVDVKEPIYDSIHSPYNSTSPIPYSASTSAFDIRCLFGGNNDADMYVVPNLDIRKGGIHSLYGGGKEGVMLGAEDYADNNAVYSHTGEGSPATNAKRSTRIEINGGDVICDTIFGGGLNDGTINDTYIHLIAGTFGTVFGGTNILGNIGYQGTDGEGRNESGIHYAKTNILIDDDPDDNEVYIKKALFGGSNGYYMCPTADGSKYSSTPLLYNNTRYSYLANQFVPTVWQTNIWLKGGYLEGKVYGGGNLAAIGSLVRDNANQLEVSTRSEGNTNILITGCQMETDILHHSRAIFGGSNYANVYGNSTIKIIGNDDIPDSYTWYPNILGDIYGGNDKAGTVTGGPSRTGFSSLALDNTHIAWDSLPDYLAEEEIDVETNYNIASNHNVALTSSNAASLITIEGYVGLGKVFGGGNGEYDYYHYDSNGNSEYDSTNSTPEIEDALFISGNMIKPHQTSSFIDVKIDEKGSPDAIRYIYGGGNYASVGENVTIGSKQFPGSYPTIWYNSQSTSFSDVSPEVDYIFGGNNHVDMSAVPRIYLLKGTVDEVFGGGNEGGMTGSISLFNDCDNASTCVMMVSKDIDVRKNIYGGCNVANVTNDTYIGIKRGTINANVFGGNNVAGDVTESHIVINGSNTYPVTINKEVFGGGNGSYTYTPNATLGGFDVKLSVDDGVASHFGVTSRPYITRTNIHVGNKTGLAASDTAVTIHGNIYGGGLAGGACQTLVDINAPNGIFDCMIFGGGKGVISEIGNASSSFNGYRNSLGDEGTTRHHAGNIHSHTDLTASTNVHIKQMKDMNVDHSSKRKAIFGGGYAGDVDGNTNVTLYNTNTAFIPAIYLGGVAADVTGTATGLFNGYETEELKNGRANTVDTIYGGNDFTGMVAATDITINSGVYQHVFGGGNGDYIYKDMNLSTRFKRTWLDTTTTTDEPTTFLDDIIASVSGCYTTPSYQGYETLDDTEPQYVHKYESYLTCIDSVPYSMKVNVTYNGGLFRGNVYGGGNMGLVGNRDMDPDDMEANDADRYANLGMIHVVINDGDFRRHVFGGARGKSNMKDRFFGAATRTETHNNNVDNMPLGGQLVYGIKQVDMYGGQVFFSLHGGSESVDDGYPFECIGPVDANTNYYKPLDYVTTPSNAGRVRYGTGLTDPNSTLRPSSIVNIIGGHVRKSLYGGGYQGNIYGSVFVNIGAEAVKDSPVWTKYGSVTAYKEGTSSVTFSDMKPTNLTINSDKPILLDASVYNCADWGEAGDKAYFNTRGVFGGETKVIIDGKGYNTTDDPFYSGDEPEMNIAFSVIGAGTSTEGGDINRLIVMRNYGSYVCPKPRKALYSIQRADKVVLDNVYLNLHGEQDAFESYASPNYALNRIDTLALCNDNVLNIESPANYIGLHASMKNVTDSAIYNLVKINGNSPNLVTNEAEGGVAQTSENLASNDILDNQVEATCTASTNPPTPETGCDQLDVCALVPTNRGDAGRPGKFNTIIIDQGSYIKISPFIDVWDNRTINNVAPHAGRDGVDDNEDAESEHEHVYGHVYGYTYLVAPLETMGYVYGIYKDNNNNYLDGGFVSPCYCNNRGEFSDEIDYKNVINTMTNTGIYRTWRIGTQNGLRKRSATLIANKEPDQILNWPLASGEYPTEVATDPQTTTLSGSNFAYATTAIELPPAKNGNFYIVESIDIDQANGGELHLIDEGYESMSGTIFQAWEHADEGQSSEQQNLDDIIAAGNEDVHNITFGLTMSSIAPINGGRVTNFSGYNDVCWLDTSSLSGVTDDSGPTNRDFGERNNEENPRDHCWPITSISGGTYFNSIGGYISNAVKSATIGVTEGVIPRIVLTLTYDTRISNTIARDVKFRMLEYDKDGNFQGPIDVTVTITTVIRDFTDIEAPVLAMYNEGQNSEYVRRINIPASFLQRDLYLEDIKWEINSALDNSLWDVPTYGRRFHLQDASTTIANNTQFAITVSPVEMVSNTLNNHLGWYDIVEENRTLDLYALAQEDFNHRTSNDLNNDQSINYTSWNVNATSTSAAPATVKYKISVDANESSYGTVTGEGSYDAGSSVTLTATHKTGYEFVNWSDGETNSTRTVTADANKTFYANFKPEGDATTYTVTVASNNVAFGTVTPATGSWYKDSKVTLTATPNANYHFMHWDEDDGATQNPYTITVGEEDITHTATFAKDRYTITAVANNSTRGSVSGSGTYDHGTSVTLTATANEGYSFVNWSDGVTTASRTVDVTGNANYTANFRVTANTTQHTITATAVTTNDGTTAGSVSVPTGEWYEGSVVDISATPADGFLFTHWSDGSTTNPRQVTIGSDNMTIVASFVKENLEEHYDGTMPSYAHVVAHEDNTWGDATKAEYYDDRLTTTSLHGKEGIKLGTLDGRAPATLDVTLKYDGTKTYHDHFSSDDNVNPGPLAWAYLKLHWYNTKIEKEGDNDGVFWVKVKLRTREKGDTIYMAPGDSLTRNTSEGVRCAVYYWNNHIHYPERNNAIESYATEIRNHPKSYVKTFPEAMRIYQEGDVIDIMETIELGSGNPLSVGNSDNVGIQIIRYSGSHYQFPSLGCANPNVLVKVNNGGRLFFRNIRFNGSGATRVKDRSNAVGGTDHTQSTSYYYNDVADRVKTIYFAESPILQCNGGQLNLTNDVSLINNFNKANYGSNGFVGGGAIAITGGGIVSMGNNTVIRDNLVVNNVSNNGTIKNYGGAVYVNNGTMRVGPSIEDAECNITIEHNYNYMGTSDDLLNNTVINTNTPPAGFYTDDQLAWKYRYIIDTSISSTLPNNWSLSNVHLTRTASTVTPTSSNATDVAKILKVRGDAINDVIQFTDALSAGSRIGVNKWFPGYIYKPSNSEHPLYNTVPRDTISVAVLTQSLKTSLAEENYNRNIFFNDSNYFAQTSTSSTRSFATKDNYTNYHDATSANPNYNDKVYDFYHKYVDENTIYFQRCASFGKGVSRQQLAYTTGTGDNVVNLKCDDYAVGDSLAFKWNPEATCNVISDTLLFKVGGGFFPYSYHWDIDSVMEGTFAEPTLYRKKDVRERFTYDPNSISDFDVPSYKAKRKSAENDTLVLYDLEEHLTDLQSTYFFQVSAEDVTGRCSVTQPIMIRVVKNTDYDSMPDADNFLLHGTAYKVATPGRDSSGFQDHSDIDGRNRQPSGTTTIDATYKVKSGNNWVVDESGNAPASDLYASNLVPRYMRSYLAYTVNPSVMPPAAANLIKVNAYPGIPGTATGDTLHLRELSFCPGTMLYLTPRQKPEKDSTGWEYMSWDFDPSSGRNTTFVVGNRSDLNKPTIYYAPSDYWWEVVNTYNNVSDASSNPHVATKADYETDYYGDVTIKTYKGLAWLISVVNGYNGQSARTMHFNTVTIADTVTRALNMEEHKWTPVGNLNNPFEGTFVGNNKTISNLIVNEESLPRVGMFGYTDSADISDLTLSKVQMKGNSYIGSLVAHAKTNKIEDVHVKDGILFTEYVAGGLVGKSESNTEIINPIISQDDDPGSDDPVSQLTVKGNAIYFGGIVGDSKATIIYNPETREIKQDYLSAVYSGSYFGTSTQVDGTKAIVRNEVHNGYAHIKSTGNADRLGGLVGRAEGLNLYNCYVYGEAKANEFTGALAGYVGSNVDISNCYYVDGLTNQVVGYGTTSAVQKSSAFHGQGKQVLLNDRVDGYNNLLRALNGWVDAQNNPIYKHWRPARGNENGGYPLFGDPEMIEVFDTFNIATCDSYDFDGITLTQSGTYVMHFVDSTDYLDSTVTLYLTLNYGDSIEVSDTVILGQPYEGYGITLTADEVRDAFGSNMQNEVATMQYIDSLLTANGCDSLIFLTLYIVNENTDIDNSTVQQFNDVKIYPNPTRGKVNVEGDDMLSVEVYDNISRRVFEQKESRQTYIFDLSDKPAGSYYIRVRTSHGTVVKKLIKK